MFLGREMARSRRYSDAVAEKIDAEVGKLLSAARETAGRIVTANRERLARVARRLVSDETIQGPELETLLRGPVGDSPATA